MTIVPAPGKDTAINNTFAKLDSSVSDAYSSRSHQSLLGYKRLGADFVPENMVRILHGELLACITGRYY